VPLEPGFDFEPWIRQAAQARGPLLAWGGDGTFHHAGRALLLHRERGGEPVPLGALPGGSGNGLVRGLRTPLDPAGALVRLLEGRDLALDLPRLDGVPFLNVCGAGFEGDVAHAFDQAPGRGFTSYAKECLGLWRRSKDLQLKWDAELPPPAGPPGRRERLRAAWRGPEPLLPETAWSLCFANLPQYGSGFWIAPGAHPADGILSWARLRKPTYWDLLAEVPQLFREGGRTPLRQEGRLLRARVRLDRPRLWHLDGEPAPARDEAELTLAPGAFPMRVTLACPYLPE
jgi:diacylglycerol kinase (ATP)